jgi:hypothetical protein
MTIVEMMIITFLGMFGCNILKETKEKIHLCFI